MLSMPPNLFLHRSHINIPYQYIYSYMPWPTNVFLLRSLSPPHPHSMVSNFPWPSIHTFFGPQSIFSRLSVTLQRSLTPHLFFYMFHDSPTFFDPQSIFYYVPLTSST